MKTAKRAPGIKKRGTIFENLMTEGAIFVKDAIAKFLKLGINIIKK